MHPPPPPLLPLSLLLLLLPLLPLLLLPLLLPLLAEKKTYILASVQSKAEVVSQNGNTRTTAREETKKTLSVTKPDN